MQATGEVYVDGTKAVGEQTLFPGDTVRTGADGAAVLMSPAFGEVIIPAQSEISFGAAPYLALLKRGSVEARSSQTATNFGIQFGSTVLFVPTPETDSTGVIVLHPDGSARVSCGLGSVALKSANGVQLAVLHVNESVDVGADGKLQTVVSGGPTQSAQTSSGPARVTGSSHTGYIILGVVAGGVTAAAIALITRKSGQPVSPSSP